MSCCDHHCHPAETGGRYRQILWVALGLNAAMFLIEIVASVIAGSVSLRADALDFLGDATAVRLIREQIQLVSYLCSIAFGIVLGKCLIGIFSNRVTERICSNV